MASKQLIFVKKYESEHLAITSLAETFLVATNFSMYADQVFGYFENTSNLLNIPSRLYK